MIKSTGGSFNIDEVFLIISERVSKKEDEIRTQLDKLKGASGKDLDQAELAKINLEIGKWSNMVNLNTNMISSFKEVMKSVITAIR